jgi:hypothetical protein
MCYKTGRSGATIFANFTTIPIGVALMTFIIGTLFLKETNKVSIHDETSEAYPTPAGAD